jgi:hypothetical protein
MPPGFLATDLVFKDKQDPTHYSVGKGSMREPIMLVTNSQGEGEGREGGGV